MKLYSKLTGSDLRVWRSEHKLSRSKAAETLGLSPSTLVDYEVRGTPVPMIVQIAMLSIELQDYVHYLEGENKRLKECVAGTRLCPPQTFVAPTREEAEKTALEKFREINEANAEARRNAGIKRNLAWMDEENGE